ncbi:iron complex transport system substrate-binding protein [Bhargavaea ginsengi]|uniref:Iron complex transport system substrate-binding protein n=1 Tax=Bhargavaea ginsengi TaxID=426757 RepID=A0A1H7AJ94_9BACL|nr:ABC transporter substrate-binding protein [Bhargavaea ginsengi]SEJ65398.1 iron complex transport system substrate-binding protein [Bhargavaea ginsengi]
MDKKWLRWLAAPAAALMLAACGSGEDAADGSAEEQEQETEQSTSGQTGFPVTMTDAVGNEITLEEEPDAIVSMVPSNTEILFAVGAGEAVVAGSDFDDYPEEAQSLEKIGGQEFNVEKIIGMQPDVVFAHESALGVGEEGLQQLRDAGLTVFVVKNAMDFDETYGTIEQIGKLTGHTAEAEEIVSGMQSKVEEIKEKAAEVTDKKKVFVETSPAPEIYTPGSGTFMQQFLDIIHAENIAGDQEGWVMMDPEEIVSRNPDVLLVMYDYIDTAVEDVYARVGFDTVTAIKDKAVIQLDENITSRTGPRLADGLEAVAKAVYPEIFGEAEEDEEDQAA